jgi:hypothetical protein
MALNGLAANASRHDRNGRAGSFMHPLGANRPYDYLARVALGEAPSLH